MTSKESNPKLGKKIAIIVTIFVILIGVLVAIFIVNKSNNDDIDETLTSSQIWAINDKTLNTWNTRLGKISEQNLVGTGVATFWESRTDLGSGMDHPSGLVVPPMINVSKNYAVVPFTINATNNSNRELNVYTELEIEFGSDNARTFLTGDIVLWVYSETKDQWLSSDDLTDRRNNVLNDAESYESYGYITFNQKAREFMHANRDVDIRLRVSLSARPGMGVSQYELFTFNTNVKNWNEIVVSVSGPEN